MKRVYWAEATNFDFTNGLKIIAKTKSARKISTMKRRLEKLKQKVTCNYFAEWTGLQ